MFSLQKGNDNYVTCISESICDIEDESRISIDE